VRDILPFHTNFNSLTQLMTGYNFWATLLHNFTIPSTVFKKKMLSYQNIFLHEVFNLLSKSASFLPECETGEDKRQFLAEVHNTTARIIKEKTSLE
jgi:hypothetical protein